jgi:septum site-determining protein MinC
MGKMRYTLYNGGNMVEIKGWRNGLLVQFSSEGIWEVLLSALETRLGEAKAKTFWKNAQTTLDLGNRMVSHDALSRLVDHLKEAYGIIPIAVVTTQAETKAAGEKLFLTVYDTLPTIQRATEEKNNPTATTASPANNIVNAPAIPTELVNNAHYLSGTIRSGQRLMHAGHLVICGDVNPGGEVLASGDILVMGKLRGMAHAGCYGDANARIIAGLLSPSQLRIADKIVRAPEEQGNKVATPTRAEVAQIKNGEIEVSPL